ncbi:hypothetical protein E2320_015547 [Naja naja]|nr:hypothetical protein E2320_015547 [Naja naja]
MSAARSLQLEALPTNAHWTQLQSVAVMVSPTPINVLSGNHITIIHQGQCEQQGQQSPQVDICSSPQFLSGCPRIYHPLCGTDNVTYPNICQFCNASRESGGNLQILHKGQCKVKVKHIGKATCLTSPPSRVFPDLEVALKAGGTGTQGSNSLMSAARSPCNLEALPTNAHWTQLQSVAVMVLSGNHITIIHQGQCEQQGQQSPQVDICSSPQFLSGCPRIYHPLCGTDNVTYPNICQFCKARRESGGNLQILHKGQCKVKVKHIGKATCLTSPPSRVFPDLEVALKAGGTGRQGSNSLMSAARSPCNSEALPTNAHWTQLQSVAVMGQQSPQVDICSSPQFLSGCPRIYHPLCGTDNVTYPNICQFCKARRESGGNLQILHKGQCKVKVKHIGKATCLTSPPSRVFPDLEVALKAGGTGTQGSNSLMSAARSPCNLEALPTNAHWTQLQSVAVMGQQSPQVDICSSPQFLSGCPRIYHPLCGTDNVTYPNICQFCKARRESGGNLQILHKGQCKVKVKHIGKATCLTSPPSRVFPDLEVALKAGGTGTQGSNSLMSAARSPCNLEALPTNAHWTQLQSVAVMGQQSPQVDICSSPQFLSGCPRIYHPLCGTDNVTYPNICQFCNASRESGGNLQILHKGQCKVKVKHIGKATCLTSPPSRVFPDLEVALKAGGTGTQGSNSLMSAARSPCNLEALPTNAHWTQLQSVAVMVLSGNHITIIHQGQCEQQGQQSPQVDICSSPQFLSGCPRIYHPLCGTDNVTYPNICQFCKARRESGGNLQILHKGQCKVKVKHIGKATCLTSPPSRVFPDLEVALKAGGTGRQGSNSLMSAARSPCNSEALPTNAHWTQLQSVAVMVLSGNHITIIHQGQCEQQGQQSPQVDICSSPQFLSGCPRIYHPLCGTDNVTYPNICQFCNASRESGGNLQILHKGQCKVKVKHIGKATCLTSPPSRVFPDLEVALKAGGTGRQGSNSLMSAARSPCNSEALPTNAHWTQLQSVAVMVLSGNHITIIHQGQCEQQGQQSPQVDICSSPQFLSGCPRIYHPLCGTDNVTYPNICQFCKARRESGGNLQILHKGQCKVKVKHIGKATCLTSPPSRVFPDLEVALKAGGTGRQGSNSLMSAARSPCNSEALPTNAHWTQLQSVAVMVLSGNHITIIHQGQCEQQGQQSPQVDICSSPQFLSGCPRIYHPLCGTDNVTYPNICQFCNASRESGGNLQILHKGQCKVKVKHIGKATCLTSPPSRVFPDLEVALKAGGTGRQGSNSLMSAARSPCNSEALPTNAHWTQLQSVAVMVLSGNHITIIHQGQCEQQGQQSPQVDICSSPQFLSGCPRIYHPLCGTDNVTYPNICQFCKARRESGGNLQILHKGQCKVKVKHIGKATCLTSPPSRVFPDLEVALKAGGTGTQGSNSLMSAARSPCNLEALPTNAHWTQLQSVAVMGQQSPQVDICSSPQFLSGCPRIYHPLCGTDNVTYPNICQFCNASRESGGNLQILHKGQCKVKVKHIGKATCLTSPPSRVFPDLEVALKAGGTGTQGSNSLMSAARSPCNSEALPTNAHWTQLQSVAVMGQQSPQVDICSSPQFLSGCPRIYHPLCGTDNVTYPNICQFCNASRESGGNLQILHKGQCKVKVKHIGKATCLTSPPSRVFPDLEVALKAGGTGRQGSNSLMSAARSPCNLDALPTNAHWTQLQSVAVMSPQVDICSSPQFLSGCPRIYHPCGTDNVTYPNICQFCKAKIYHPLCGTDNVTYPNICPFCKARRATVSSSRHLQLSPVLVRLPQDLPSSLWNDNVTYPNICQFCKARRESGGNLQILHKGQCKVKVKHIGKATCLRPSFSVFPDLEVALKAGGTGGREQKDAGRNLCPSFSGMSAARSPCNSEALPTNAHWTQLQSVAVMVSPTPINVLSASPKGPTVSSSRHLQLSQFLSGCPRIYHPLCGTDNVTYPNICQFCKARGSGGNLQILHKGQCKVKVKHIGKATCLTSLLLGFSQTLKWLLKLEAQGGREQKDAGRNLCPSFHRMSAARSPCNSGGLTHQCTLDSAPICGSDGVTYPNKCAFCIAKRLALEICVHLDEKVPSEGSCCPEKWVPSTSQRSYRTTSITSGFGHCMLSGNHITIIHQGQCEQQLSPVLVGCPRIYHPLCGTDNVTYPNICQFCKARVSRFPTLQLNVTSSQASDSTWANYCIPLLPKPKAVCLGQAAQHSPFLLLSVSKGKRRKSSDTAQRTVQSQGETHWKSNLSHVPSFSVSQTLKWLLKLEAQGGREDECSEVTVQLGGFTHQCTLDSAPICGRPTVSSSRHLQLSPVLVRLPQDLPSSLWNR